MALLASGLHTAPVTTTASHPQEGNISTWKKIIDKITRVFECFVNQLGRMEYSSLNGFTFRVDAEDDDDLTQSVPSHQSSPTSSIRAAHVAPHALSSSSAHPLQSSATSSIQAAHAAPVELTLTKSEWTQLYRTCDSCDSGRIDIDCGRIDTSDISKSTFNLLVNNPGFISQVVEWEREKDNMMNNEFDGTTKVTVPVDKSKVLTFTRTVEKSMGSASLVFGDPPPYWKSVKSLLKS